jgi:hypothetical protein
MFSTIALLMALLVNSSWAFQTAFDIDLAKSRCRAHFTQSPEVYASDYKWGYTLLEMQDRFEDHYASGKRLHLHPNYDPEKDQFILYFGEDTHQPFVINENFIKSVTNHIEVAIREGFADYVFFPDMGHAHLHFPQQIYDDVYRPMDKSLEKRHLFYQAMFEEPQMKALYHLTEQLQMVDDHGHVLDDPVLAFKYWNRNFVGPNNGDTSFEIFVAEDSNYNTVRRLEGYQIYSAGYSVSASKDGCFPYRDKEGNTRYFDISVQPLRFDPSNKNADVWGL